MTREEKAVLIEELKGKISSNDNVYVTDASGLTVAEINVFRGLCFDAGLEYKVYKNTLIKKALEQSGKELEELNEALAGFSGLVFSPEAGNAPAKVLKKYRGDDGEKPVLKGAAIGQDVYLGDENLKMLSDLKSREELIGEIIGLLQSPAKNVISALTSGGSKLSGIVKTLSERAE